MGLPSSLDDIADSDRSDAARNEKLLRTELDGVERGEALGLIGAFASLEAESSSIGPNLGRVGRSPNNLVTSGAEDGPT